MNSEKLQQTDIAAWQRPETERFELPAGFVERNTTENDFHKVQDALRVWWPQSADKSKAQQRALLVPRLYLQHFNDTSFILEDQAGQLKAFLIGFMSQSQEDVGYIHFVGVDPSERGAGLGRHLYTRFFEATMQRGASEIQCITSPENTGSVLFHTAMGFDIKPGPKQVNGVPVQPDYGGVGVDRVVFSRNLQHKR